MISSDSQVTEEARSPTGQQEIIMLAGASPQHSQPKRVEVTAASKRAQIIPGPATPVASPSPSNMFETVASQNGSKAVLGATGTDSDNKICPICFEVAVNPVLTPCSHTFCSDCIAYWLAQCTTGKSCPQCRQGLRQFARRLSFSDRLPDAWRFEDQDLPTVNSRVEANFGNQGRYYGGVVAAANDDGTFQVQYDDGDFEASVLRSNIRIS
eukprot:COSAG02_NODE_6575_length_3485_cov_19.926757_3_plen_211_part_00